jgi:hypothetical protein
VTTSADAQELLADRIRSSLAGRDVREVRTFGGLSFMIDDSLIVSASRDGGLFVRVDSGCRADLLARPGVRPAAMKNGREMGDGWLPVGAEGVVADDDQRFWLDVGEATRPS